MSAVKKYFPNKNRKKNNIKGGIIKNQITRAGGNRNVRKTIPRKFKPKKSRQTTSLTFLKVACHLDTTRPRSNSRYRMRKEAENRAVT